MWIVDGAGSVYMYSALSSAYTLAPSKVSLVSDVKDVSVSDGGQVWFVLNNNTLFSLLTSSEAMPLGKLQGHALCRFCFCQDKVSIEVQILRLVLTVPLLCFVSMGLKYSIASVVFNQN